MLLLCCGFIKTMLFPSKNRSALWNGKKNWKAWSEIVTDVRLVTLEGFQHTTLSGLVSSPRRINAKNPTSNWDKNKRSSWSLEEEYVEKTAGRY